MLCEKCGKNMATTHIKRVVNGVRSEMHLCSECASKEGFNNFSDISLSGMLSSMLGDVSSPKTLGGAKQCECCGAYFSDIAENGKAGCPECYKTFYGEFLPYIKRVHGSAKHIGKTLEVKKESTDTLASLKEQLQKLISEEKFEQAAEIRDKIKDLEAGK